jgi:hypothetical protein
VIVHELLHLLVPNHGKLFKSLMTAYLPDWERQVGSRANSLYGSSGIGRRRTSDHSNANPNGRR